MTVDMNYYLLLIVLILAAAILMRGWEQGNIGFVVVACLLLFSIYGLRNTFVIGGDTTSSYLHTFERMAGRSWSDVANMSGGTNPGFYLLAKGFHQLSGGDYQLFVSVIAGFVTVCFSKLLYRYSPNPLQSILYHFGLLYFTFYFSVLKQSLAMAILMLAFDCLMQGKTLKYFLLVLLAAQFHFPAYVFLLAWPMSKLRIGRNYLFFLAIMLALTYLFRNQIINLMLNTYKDLEDSTANINMAGITFLRTKALIMLGIIIAAVVLRKPKPEDRIYSTLLEFMGVALVFQTFCGYNNIFERLADYYFQYAVIFIPMVFDKKADREPLFNRREMGLVDFFAPLLFSGYGVYRFLTYTQSERTLYPFVFFFQNK